MKRKTARLVASTLFTLLFAVAMAVASLFWLAALMGVLAAGCGHLTTQDRVETETYGGELGACIAATPKDTPAIEACQANVRKKWCGAWKTRFDADICQPEGGK